MRKYLTLITMLFLSLSLFAQSDEVLDVLYEQENAQTLITSLLVLQAAGAIDFDSNTDDAREYLEGVSWGSTILEDVDYITAGSFSLLVMESFNLPHGLVYNFLPIKRYALKELVYQKLILGNPYPNDVMSSFDVVYVLSSLPVSEEINENYVDSSEQ